MRGKGKGKRGGGKEEKTDFSNVQRAIFYRPRLWSAVISQSNSCMPLLVTSLVIT